MKALSTFDLYLWNWYIPVLNEKSFKNRILCLLAMTYISVYKLPRKFLINYFKGNGNEMVIDSNKLIKDNSVILDKLFEAIIQYKNNGVTDGAFNICQTDVHDPGYKYSVGSFTVNYLISNETLEITIQSYYQFKPNPNRLTRHLHSWLFSMTKKGYAKSFVVKSLPLTMTFTELVNAKMKNKPERHPKQFFLI